MTESPTMAEPRRSRWLPTLVFSLFALIFLADAVVIALYGNYRNLIEEQGVEVVFTPARSFLNGTPSEPVEVLDGVGAVAADGTEMVSSSGVGYEVLVPGTLTILFRAPDAGSFVELDYRFGESRPDLQVDLSLARVASRHGVDYMNRREIKAKKKSGGTYRHYLADHAGWFELALDVNAEVAAGGFEVGRPEIVWN